MKKQTIQDSIGKALHLMKKKCCLYSHGGVSSKNDTEVRSTSPIGSRMIVFLLSIANVLLHTCRACSMVCSSFCCQAGIIAIFCLFCVLFLCEEKRNTFTNLFITLFFLSDHQFSHQPGICSCCFSAWLHRTQKKYRRMDK